MNKTQTAWRDIVGCPHCREAYYPGNIYKNEIIECPCCDKKYKILAKVIQVKKEVYRSEKAD